MFCSKCGKEVVDGALFCPYCGTPVGNNQYSVGTLPKTIIKGQTKDDLNHALYTVFKTYEGNNFPILLKNYDNRAKRSS